MNILCIGDIVGAPGRHAVLKLIQDLKREFSLHAVIANAENSAAGSGITKKIAQELLSGGCDILTLGDHVWDQKETEELLAEIEPIVRPANFPSGAPGKGWIIRKISTGQKLAVINLLGRTFMRYQVECPFKALRSIVDQVKKETPFILLDIHAETTSEKVAMGHFIDGDISAIVGTHTHVQTADEQILPKGTAYITDLGMTGPHDSVIGQDKEIIIKRFLTSRPIRFSVAHGNVKLHGAVIEIDDRTGKALRIERISRSVAYSQSA